VYSDALSSGADHPRIPAGMPSSIEPSGPGWAFELMDARDYERLRPAHAEEAVDLLVSVASLTIGSLVVDVGAGTGQLTRPLLARGLRCLAVEPAANQAGELRLRTPGAMLVRAVGERLPIRDGLADCVTVAHAFHWLEGPPALREFDRVLKTTGWLAVLWTQPNHEGPGSSIHVGVDAVMEPFLDHDSPMYGAMARWEDALRASDVFEAFTVRSFPSVHVLDPEDLPASTATSSDVGTLPADRRSALLEAVRAFASGLDGPIELAMTTTIHLYRSAAGHRR
jgi:SAM-dependent methyltransferase